MIEVLIVEDSPVICRLLGHILESDPGIRVMKSVNSGEEAIDFLKRAKPDLITMDINMPGMNGIEATRRIMRSTPLPIIIISGHWNPSETEKSFEALRAGAIALLEKPRGLAGAKYPAMAKSIIEKVKAMSEVRMVRRWYTTMTPFPVKRSEATETPPSKKGEGGSAIDVIAIGASTGGPPALREILSHFPSAFPVPLLIVQHIADGFMNGLVEWLNNESELTVRLAKDNEFLQPGRAYCAPSGFQMQVKGNGTIHLAIETADHVMSPTVSSLFRSVAQNKRNRAIGVLLTGMGKDGARELKMIKDAGAVTIAQDKSSSVVHGMPGEAIKLGAATHVLGLKEIGPKLKALVGN